MPLTLAARGVRKRFGATLALDAVDFDLAGGEVHALVGENGAGKSTLIRIFGGVHRPDAGELRLDGRPLLLHSPADAFRAGIAIIQQELRVVPALSVAENVMLGHLPRRGLALDTARMRSQASEALARLHLALDVDQPVGRLAFGERQAVAIARALSREARVLILDEPTAALEEREVESLFEVIGRLKGHGVAVLYVSHRLDEIPRIAGRCTVLRDGRVVAELAGGAFEVPEVIRHMVGRAPVYERAAARCVEPGQPLLEHAGVVLGRGETVGLAGLLGSGTAALLRRLFARPAAAIRAGRGFVPSERAASLIAEHSVRDNIVLPSLRRFGWFARIDDTAIDALVGELVAALDIRPADPRLPVRALSGGNQQKVVLARWLAARVQVLLMDEPTQGIDVAAKAHLHALMRRFAAEGGAVLFASSDLRELTTLAGRVLAMRDGRVQASLAGEALDERSVREAIG